MTLDDLLGGAGKIVPGIEINAVLYGIREQLDSSIGYEMVLDGRTLEDLLYLELPKLTEHLFAKRLPMLGAPQLILTLWRDGRAHIFAGDAFFDALARGLALTHDALRDAIAGWRSDAGFLPDPWMGVAGRTSEDRGSAPIGLLPPPKR